jgi:predicted TIM-barrel fold metal-dependent hydrolase
MKIIALEEHFVISEVKQAWQSLPSQDGVVTTSSEEVGRRLVEFGSDRIDAMDASGVDVQVLSLTSPGVQNLAADESVELARTSNDRVAEVVAGRPDRFQGFATLPTPAPEAAPRELERAVGELGLQGAMVFGRTGARNFDHADFWPIFEAASALKAPLYMHPQTPQRGVVDAYYKGYGELADWLFSGPGIGWHYETGLQIVRMALAGVFDRFPDLQIVTGHMGEVVVFYLERLDIIPRAAKLPRTMTEYFKQHVHVTPSGLFSQRYLRWAVEVLGVDRILMSADYPYVTTPKGGARVFLEQASLSDEERVKIASGNWERLCAGIRR